MKKKQEKKTPATPFDYQNFEKEALTKLRGGQGLIGTEGALTGLLKHLLEASRPIPL